MVFEYEDKLQQTCDDKRQQQQQRCLFIENSKLNIETTKRYIDTEYAFRQ